MPVLTWGYGTGAVGTGAHPFCLRIQGVDVIGSVPLDTITVSQSVSGNATLTFSIYDAAGTFPVPQGWADVEFLDTTEEEYVFGGLVMGTTLHLDATPSRWIDVRCVDYGVLLDVTPVTYSLTANGSYGTGDWPPNVVVQNVAAAAPLGGITAIRWETGGDGRVVASKDGTDFTIFYAEPETITSPTTVRSAAGPYADRVEIIAITDPLYTLAPADLYVTPLKQLALLPAGQTFGAAPLEVRVNPTTGSHIAAESIEVDRDHRSIETGAYFQDTYTDDGDQSAFGLSTVNGYTVAPSTRSWPDVGSYYYVQEYIAARGTAPATGRVTVTTVKNFMVGQALTVYYPAAGLDGIYAIHAVTTRFLGGTTILRRSEIQFGGELGTVAKFNRTRFARAGVRT